MLERWLVQRSMQLLFYLGDFRWGRHKLCTLLYCCFDCAGRLFGMKIVRVVILNFALLRLSHGNQIWFPLLLLVQLGRCLRDILLRNDNLRVFGVQSGLIRV